MLVCTDQNIAKCTSALFVYMHIKYGTENMLTTCNWSNNTKILFENINIFFYCSLVSFLRTKFSLVKTNSWYGVHTAADISPHLFQHVFFPLHFFSCFIRRYAWNSIKVGNLFSSRFISSIQLRSIDGCQFILKFVLNQHIMMKIIWLWYGSTVKNGSVTKNRILKPKIAYWNACID